MTKYKLAILGVSIVATLLIFGCSKDNTIQVKQAIIGTYANMATASYNDVLNDVKLLETAINKFTNNPTQENLDQAKDAWLFSRESYGQSEIFRLSNGPIDSEEEWIAQAYGALESQINPWPLDENMIDYTIDGDGNKTKGNIIDTARPFNPGGKNSRAIDVTTITQEVLTKLNENGGEANVATGYHAIEFLLWGQDQDYSSFIKDDITKGALIAGQRPLSDFTSDEFASRRIAYLKAVTVKLVTDLELVSSAWEDEVNGNKGLYKAALLNKAGDKNINLDVALQQIFLGMSIFMKSELGNERIGVALLTPSEEDEQSCFSDNTHRDIVNNYQGFKNVLLGSYNGKKYGIAPLDSFQSYEKSKIINLMASIEEKISLIDQTAKTSRHFDYQIRPEDSMSKVIVKLKNEMRRLGDEMLNVAKFNDIELNADDILNSEEALM